MGDRESWQAEAPGGGEGGDLELSELKGEQHTVRKAGRQPPSLQHPVSHLRPKSGLHPGNTV